MPNEKTTFVVGAGASTDVGLDVGNVFKYEVADRISTVQGRLGFDQLKDIQINAAVERLAATNDERVPIDDYFHACKKIIDSTPGATSIDSVLEIHQDDLIATIIGKMAIVRSILESERDSDLNIDPEKWQVGLDLRNLEKTWYMHLLRFLCGSSPFDRLETEFEKVTLIVFNYDRCIEHFLYHALQQHYDETPDNVADLLMHHLKILHPYGTVGNLPWLGGPFSVEYGNTKVSKALLDLAHQIYTYNEAVEAEEGQKVYEIRTALQEAVNVVFLGYAFHEQNMRLIRPEIHGSAVFVASTNLDNSASNCGAIKRAIIREFYPNLSINAIYYETKLDCAALFSEYERALA